MSVIEPESSVYLPTDPWVCDPDSSAELTAEGAMEKSVYSDQVEDSIPIERNSVSGFMLGELESKNGIGAEAVKGLAEVGPDTTIASGSWLFNNK